MADTKPGDGKTNPFGNGAGGAGGAGSMGNNFVTNPGGSGGRGKAPRSFVTPAPEKATQSKGGPPPNPQSKTAGPETAAQVVTPADRPGNPIGQGPGGSGNKPFKLGNG